MQRAAPDLVCCLCLVKYGLVVQSLCLEGLHRLQLLLHGVVALHAPLRQGTATGLNVRPELIGLCGKLDAQNLILLLPVQLLQQSLVPEWDHVQQTAPLLIQNLNTVFNSMYNVHLIPCI